MNKEQASNWWKLIDFLEQLPDEQFNFNEIVAQWDAVHKCGTVCCAIGWTPKLFPDKVRWLSPDLGGSPCVTVDREDGWHMKIICDELFGLDEGDYWLFIPRGWPQPQWPINGKYRARVGATAKEVAGCMRLLIADKYPQHIRTSDPQSPLPHTQEQH